MGCNIKALIHIIITCVDFTLEPATLFDIVPKTESLPQPPRALKYRVIARVAARYRASAPTLGRVDRPPALRDGLR